MITLKTIFLIFIFILISSQLSHAQDLNIHYMIGKKQSEVIKKYGNPVHRDDTNPEMLCMFYKSKLNTMIFVSNKTAVYQIESSKTYDTIKDAMKDLDACIAKSAADGFAIDSVTTSDFRLHAKGVKADLQLSENKLSNKFEIRMKAHKTED